MTLLGIAQETLPGVGLAGRRHGPNAAPLLVKPEINVSLFLIFFSSFFLIFFSPFKAAYSYLQLLASLESFDIFKIL